MLFLFVLACEGRLRLLSRRSFCEQTPGPSIFSGYRSGKGGNAWQYIHHDKAQSSCKSGGIMRRMIRAGAIGIAALVGLAFVSGAHAQEKDGWKGAPRTFLWNPGRFSSRTRPNSRKAHPGRSRWPTPRFRMYGRWVGCIRCNMSRRSTRTSSNSLSSPMPTTMRTSR